MSQLNGKINGPLTWVQLQPMAHSTPLSPEAASRLSTVANIGSIEVFRLMANLDESPQGKGNLSWNLKDPTFYWERNGRVLVALLLLQLSITLQTEEPISERRLGVIQVGYRVEYTLKEELESDEDVPHFVGISGFLHVWPYLRSEVQSLTTKLGLPSLTLPVLLSGHAATMVTVKHVREAGSSEHAGDCDSTKDTAPPVPKQPAASE